MSVIDAPAPAALPRSYRLSAFWLVWLLAAAIFIAIGAHLSANGYARGDFIELWNETGRAGADGVWLSALVMHTLGWLPQSWAGGALSIFTFVIAGLSVSLLYKGLRRNQWRPWSAAVLVALFAGNALTLYAVTAASSAIPLILACALIVPSIRRLESVGDVQAEMGFGLVLPLFLLAGPLTTPLVPVLAVLSALSDPEARRDFRAFFAMFLVAILPSLIVLMALLYMHFDQGGSLGAFVAPYSNFYVREGPIDWLAALIELLLLAPVALAPIVYCLQPDRRMQPFSALATIAIPLYLFLGRTIFGWHIEAWAPAAALLAGFFAWVSVARLRPALRAAAAALIAISAIGSWVFAEQRLQSDWTRALAENVSPAPGAMDCSKPGPLDPGCLRGFADEAS